MTWLADDPLACWSVGASRTLTIEPELLPVDELPFDLVDPIW